MVEERADHGAFGRCGCLPYIPVRRVWMRSPGLGKVRGRKMRNTQAGVVSSFGWYQVSMLPFELTRKWRTGGKG